MARFALYELETFGGYLIDTIAKLAPAELSVSVSIYNVHHGQQLIRIRIVDDSDHLIAHPKRATSIVSADKLDTMEKSNHAIASIANLWNCISSPELMIDIPHT